MKKNTMYKALGVTFGALLISACASKGDMDEGAMVTETVEPVVETTTTAVDPAKLRAQALADEMKALMNVTTFYFDFDEATIKAEGRTALMAHAAYLKENSGAKVVLQGHADERGTPEYNLALGERRGIAVRRFLMANGAAASQLSVVSFGEERPAVSGSSEESYAKNRRVELKYQSR